MDLNRATLIGFVGQDAEVKQSKNDKQFATFSLATSDSWKDRQTGETKRETQWHNIKVFNDKLVELVRENAKKGARVLVEGKVKYRKYKDKAGVEKSTADIEIEAFTGQIIFFDKKMSSNITQVSDDEIPF